jgi:hypothetical protein
MHSLEEQIDCGSLELGRDQLLRILQRLLGAGE